MENNNEEIKETTTNEEEPKLQRLHFFEYRPPVSFEVIPDSKMYNLEKEIREHIEYNEACRARGRVAAGNHIAGGR